MLQNNIIILSNYTFLLVIWFLLLDMDHVECPLYK